MESSENIRLFRNVSVWVWISSLGGSVHDTDQPTWKLGEEWNMKLIVFHSQLIHSLEDLGMFFSSAALVIKLRNCAATETPYDVTFIIFKSTNFILHDDLPSFRELDSLYIYTMDNLYKVACIAFESVFFELKIEFIFQLNNLYSLLNTLVLHI